MSARPDVALRLARPVDTIEQLHGESVVDPFRWIEDPASERARAWWRAQTLAGRRHLDKLSGRARFGHLVEKLGNYSSVSQMMFGGSKLFLLLREYEGRSRVSVVEGTNFGDTLIEGDTQPLELLSVSGNGRRAACRGRGGLRIVDTRARASWSVDVPGEKGGALASFTPSGGLLLGGQTDTDLTLWWSRRRPWRPEIPLVTLRTSLPAVGLTTSPTGRYACVTCREAPYADTELFLVELRSKGWSGRSGVIEACVDPWFLTDETLMVRTDLDHPDGRLALVSIDRLATRHWKEIVSVEDGVLNHVAVVGGRAIFTIDRDGWSRVLSAEPGQRCVETVASLQAPLCVVTALAGTRSGQLAIALEALHTEPEVRVGCLKATCSEPVRVVRLNAVQQAPPNDSLSLTYEQACVPNGDVSLPLTLLSKPRGRSRRPTIVLAYGGFGIPENLEFNVFGTAWAVAGGRFVVAGVRGGGERGWRWHNAAVGEKKRTSVDDLVASVEWLIEAGLSEPGGIGLLGGSHGGMLAAAAAVSRPDLFGAVVCAAPLLDLVRFERFGLGDTWTDEFGSVGNAGDFKALHALSPYHGLRPDVKYPPFLFALFEGDSVVDNVHAKKMTAALEWVAAAVPSKAPPVVVRMAKPSFAHGSRSAARCVDLLAFFADRLRLRQAP